VKILWETKIENERMEWVSKDDKEPKVVPYHTWLSLSS
jgi:hypothetical protein